MTYTAMLAGASSAADEGDVEAAGRHCGQQAVGVVLDQGDLHAGPSGGW